MLRFRSSLRMTPRYTAMLVACLLTAQLALFAHALGHDYLKDADQSHVVCDLCIVAHHLDHGLAPVNFELPRAGLGLLDVRPLSLVDFQLKSAPFQARAPPLTLPL